MSAQKLDTDQQQPPPEGKAMEKERESGWELQEGSELYYSPLKGMYPCDINMYTEHAHHVARRFFAVLDWSGIAYGVFAGQSVGLLRSGRNIPWVDDYDVIVHVDTKEIIETHLIPIFHQMGLKIILPEYNAGVQFLECRRDGAGNVIDKKESCFFQCDIFYSYFDQMNCLRNARALYGRSPWGLYNRANIPRDCVLPFRRRRFHDMYLPFFNDVEKEVRLTYGPDAVKKAVFSTHVKITQGRCGPWQTMYGDFEKYVSQAVARTRKLIAPASVITNSEKTTKWCLGIGRESLQELFGSQTPSEITILQHIAQNNINIISLAGPPAHHFVLCYLPCIRFYFPDIQIHLFLCTPVIETVFDHLSRGGKRVPQKGPPSIFTQMLPFLSYATHIYTRTEQDRQTLQTSPWITGTTPTPAVIHLRVITFGTFDLFHAGHKNILQHCLHCSDTVVVGLSTDRFTHTKKQITPTHSFDQRRRNLRRHGATKVFAETSLEKKNEYIQKHQAHMLLMGDDWKGKFDWVDARVVHVPRTPGISSTLLRARKITR